MAGQSALAVVSYPRFAARDLERIQSIRRAHDPLCDVIAPHFTLVFPTRAVAESTLVEHVRERSRLFRPFEVVLRCAIVGDREAMGGVHAFLLPDEGLSEIVHLHDALYSGRLAEELRLDLPFVPHVTIARMGSAEACKGVVDAVNAERLEVRGRIERLEVVGYDGEKAWTVAAHELGPGHPSE